MKTEDTQLDYLDWNPYSLDPTLLTLYIIAPSIYWMFWRVAMWTEKLGLFWEMYLSTDGLLLKVENISWALEEDCASYSFWYGVRLDDLHSDIQLQDSNWLGYDLM